MLKTVSKIFKTTFNIVDHRQCMMMVVGWLDGDVVTVLFSLLVHDCGIILILYVE